MTKRIVEDDLDLELPSYEGQTLEELYEIMGANLFDEENLPLLKQAGLIDDHGPIEKYENWRGEDAERYMDLVDIYNLGADLIESKYIRDWALNEIRTYFANSMDDAGESFKITYHDGELPRISDMSEEFIQAAFSGEDIWEFFSGYTDYSFGDCSYVLDDIAPEVLDTLESFGFPRDIYQQLAKGTEDEDSPLEKYYESLKDACAFAYRQGQEDGSANAALNDFNNAWRESIPDGCEWIETETVPEKRLIRVPMSFVEKNLIDIWNIIGDYSNDIGDCVREFIVDSINTGLEENFREPYYGWQDFDEDVFNDRLLDEILSLDIPEANIVDVDPEAENSLLKFNGETGEYEEDLDLDVVKAPKKPEKLFYKYKEFNKELSSKAYKLDIFRLQALIDYLSKNGWRCDVHSLDTLKNYLEDAEEDDDTGIVMSSIKPSYQSYDGPGYSIWSIVYGGYYELQYLCWIPKHIGDEILNHGYIKEELELDVVPVPDIEIGPACRLSHPYEVIADIVANRFASPNWIVQWYNVATEEYENHYFDTLESAAEYFKKSSKDYLLDDDDTLYLIFAPTADDPDYDGGETYPVAVLVGPDEALTEEVAKPEEEILSYYVCFWEPDTASEENPDPEHEYETLLVCKQTNGNIELTPAEALAMYSYDGQYECCPGYHIYDVNGITKKEAQEKFGDLSHFEIYDADKYVATAVDLKEEEAQPDYTYYECYMEPADSTTWNPETFEWDDGEPSYDNQSIIIKVHDSLPEPTPREAEEFLASIGELPKGYTVLYLGEDVDDYLISDLDNIPDYLPRENVIDIDAK